MTAMDIGNNGEVWIAADSLDGQGQGFGQVNTATGDSTFLTAGPERISALATSANGVLYAFSYSQKVYTVNTTDYSFTLVGTTQDSMMAADIDGSGDMILTSFFGNVSKYDFDTNTSTLLFTMKDSNDQSILVEALGVGGPTNGQTLTQAVAEAASPSPSPATVVPAVVPSVATVKVTASAKIKFDRSSSVLTKVSKAKLRKLAKSIGADANIKVLAAVGPLNNASQSQMRSLAKLRAKAIAKYLKSQKRINQTYKIKIIEEGVKPVTSVTAN